MSSRRTETDRNELGERAAHALDNENSGDQRRTRAAIYGRSLKGAGGALTKPGRTMRELRGLRS
jgi:hypothetical protein